MIIQKLHQNKLGRPLGQPIGKRPLYSRILSTRPQNLIQYLPMSEPLGSAVALDRSLQGNDGAYTAVILGENGIGDGRTAGEFDGVTSFVNAYSAAFNADFNGAEGTAFIWANNTDTTATRRMFSFTVDGNNRLWIALANPVTGLLFKYESGGVDKVTTIVNLVTQNAWSPVAMTWSETADELKFYVDGVQVGATINGLGNWAGNLNAGFVVVGAGSTAPAVVWQGNLQHEAIWNVPLSSTEIARLATV